MSRFRSSSHVLKACFLLLLSFVAALLVVASAPFRAVSQTSPTNLIGYAWSENVGWVDLNCSNSDSCISNNFGIRIEADGVLSGQAWSDNIGWISSSEADLLDCPAAPCSARLTESGLDGWMRALAGGTAESGGWDGWIRLRGESPSYGVLRNGSLFSGFAWGSTVVGWLDFSFAGTNDAQLCSPVFACTDDGTGLLRREYRDGQCVSATFFATCAPGVCSLGACVYDDAEPEPVADLRAVPSIVRSGETAKLFWSSENALSCAVRGDVVDMAGGGAWEALASPGGGVTTSPIEERTTYTLTCVGEGDATVQKSAVINILPVFEEL